MVALLENMIHRLRSPGLRRYLANTSWMLADHVVRIGLALAAAIVVARALGPDRYGVLSFAVALATLAWSFSPLGLRGIVVRQLVDEPESRDEILGTVLALRSAAGLLGILVAVLVVTVTHPGDSTVLALVAIVSIGLAFRSFEVVESYFQAQVQARRVAVARTGAGLVANTGKIVIAATGGPLIAIGAFIASESVLFALLLSASFGIAGGSIRTWRFRRARAFDLLRRSWPLVLSSVGMIVYLKIDQVMLGRMVGDTAVGLYAAAARLSESWWFIPNAIAASVFPALIRVRERDPEAYRNRLQWLFDGLAWFALLLAVALSLVAGRVVELIYGADFAAAGPIFAIHIWSFVFMSMRAVLSKWIILEHAYKFSLVTHGSGAVINVILNLIFIPPLGGVGAAIATVISYAVASYFALFLHRDTLPAAVMMSRALVAPIRRARELLGSRGGSG